MSKGAIGRVGRRSHQKEGDRAQGQGGGGGGDRRLMSLAAEGIFGQGNGLGLRWVVNGDGKNDVIYLWLPFCLFIVIVIL